MNRSTVGRYRDRASALQPGTLPREGKAQNGQAQIKHGAVDDPNPVFAGKRQRVAINVKTDPLENEYAQGRISEAGYRAARVYQRILELASGKPSGSGQWMEGGRVDIAGGHEFHIAHALDSARDAVQAIFEVQRITGAIGAKVLRMALVERMTLTQIAEHCDGAANRMQVSFYAETFRRSCEEIAKSWVASERD